MVGEEFAAAVGQDRWVADKPCLLLVASAGREAYKSALNWQIRKRSLQAVLCRRDATAKDAAILTAY